MNILNMIFVLILSILSIPGAFAQSLKSQDHGVTGLAGVVIEPSRRMQGAGIEWDHEIQIALPPSYNETDKEYPVLWVTDGSIWFQTAVQIANISGAKYAPEMIIVGIGVPSDSSGEYANRRLYDFTPHEGPGFEGFGSTLLGREIESRSRHAKDMGMAESGKYGGAQRFIEFLVDVVRPALKRDYRMAKENVLFGDSAGGLFCTYALLTRPESFTKYICGSPALSWGNHEIFRIEERRALAKRDLPASVFFGAGEGEILEGGVISGYGIVSSMSRMAEILKLRSYPSLQLHVRIFPSEGHDSVIPVNLAWGLRTLWKEEML